MDLYARLRPRRWEDMYRTSEFLANIPARIAKELQESGGIPTAFMFHSEMPGLGKTTCSRILASELNPTLSDKERDALFLGEDNPVCVHINGGAYRKIDQIRVLIDKIESLRVPLYDYRYMFIIDEVHKLTEDSLDALLAPVENSPNNVYFTFTTTEMDKLSRPKTPGDALLSRCEKHRFYPLKKAEVRNLVAATAKILEKQTPEDRVIDTIYLESGGSPRNVMVALSQYFESGTISSISAQEEQAPYFKDLVNLYCDMLKPGSRVSWSSDFQPLIRSMLSDFSAEEIRIKLLHRIYHLLVYDTIRGKSVGQMYDILGTELRGFVGAPHNSELVTRLYSVFTKVKELASEE